jgi:hypothetical protein
LDAAASVPDATDIRSKTVKWKHNDQP